MLIKRRNKRATTVQYCINALTIMEPFFRFSEPVLLGSVMKHIASAKLELGYADSKIDAVGIRNATNFEVFENDLMVDVSNLLLLGQIWRVIEIIRGNQPKSQTRNVAMELDRKIKSLAGKINQRGEFTPIPLQRLIQMQLGSILVIADVLSNGVSWS